MKTMHNRMSGVTLIEVLLVTVIISAILYMGMGYLQQKTLQARLDKAAAQMQQILNAASAYYAANGKWPVSVSCLQGGAFAGCTVAYLPPNLNTSPFGGAYFVQNGPTAPLFTIYTPIFASTQVKSYANATTLAGMLPLAFTSNGTGVPGTCTTASASNCVVFTSVTQPGQNLNNATAVNFAAVYHNGACVPVPSCPDPSLQASIIAVPASVTGINTKPGGSTANCNPTDLSGCTVDAYPLSSFTAFVTPPAAAGAGTGPNGCTTGVPQPCYSSYSATGVPSGAAITTGAQYWRVCLTVVTEKGIVNPSDPTPATQIAWGQLAGTIMAITRCSVSGESAGSGFTVWGQ